MSLFVPQFQIASDLHLETPVTQPCYRSFHLNTHCNNLFLLGDIGLVKDNGLFHFLRGILNRDRGLRIFYVLGNHESYQMCFSDCLQKMKDFEHEARADFAGRFIFLHRNRYDLNGTITILGCTLWTAISAEQSKEVAARLTDFNEIRGIVDWTLDQHLDEHRKDVDWLNAEVAKLQVNEPHRQIIVLTHHCPTKDLRAIEYQYRESPVSSGFATDLSDQSCWTSPSIRLWAFGHTHYSCAFHDDATGKLVVSNQKGYFQLERSQMNGLKEYIITPTSQRWEMIQVQGQNDKDEERKETEQQIQKEIDSKQKTKQKRTVTPPPPLPKRSLLDRAANSLKGLRRMRPGAPQ